VIGYYQLSGAIKFLQAFYFVSHDAESVHQPDQNIRTVMHDTLYLTNSLQAISRQNGQSRKDQKPLNKPARLKLKKLKPVAKRRQP
jgi:hypothetical protein